MEAFEHTLGQRDFLIEEKDVSTASCVLPFSLGSPIAAESLHNAASFTAQSVCSQYSFLGEIT